MFKLFLILVFIRPFISSLTEPNYLNLSYSYLFLGFLLFWIIIKDLSLKLIKPFRYPFILFIIAILLSFLFSYDKLNSLKEIYKYLTYLLVFWVSLSLNSEQKSLLIRTIVLAGLLISILAIYQYLFGFRHLQDYITKHNITDPFILDYVSRKRVFFPFVTPNILGGYLAMIIPLSFNYKNKIIYIIPLSLALLLTRSLGALLSLLVGLIVYFFLTKRLKKKILFLLLGLFILIIWVFILRTLEERYHTQPLFSTLMRLNYWKDTLRIIKMHPWAGIGIGNFNLIQSRYAHNSYLQLWAEMGLLGLIAIIWITIASLKSTIIFILKSSLNRTQPVSLISFVIIFLIHNFIDFSFFLPEVASLWWVILSLITPYLYIINNC